MANKAVLAWSISSFATVTSLVPKNTARRSADTALKYAAFFSAITISASLHCCWVR